MATKVVVCVPDEPAGPEASPAMTPVGHEADAALEEIPVERTRLTIGRPPIGLKAIEVRIYLFASPDQIHRHHTSWSLSSAYLELYEAGLRSPSPAAGERRRDSRAFAQLGGLETFCAAVTAVLRACAHPTNSSPQSQSTRSKPVVSRSEDDMWALKGILGTSGKLCSPASRICSAQEFARARGLLRAGDGAPGAAYFAWSR